MASYDSSKGPQGRIEDYYDVGSRLTADAFGAGGEVVRGIRKSDQKAFAVKIIRYGRTREDKQQIQTLTEVNHPGIIRLVDWFETPEILYVVMEMALGGEMFGRIAERGAFTELEAANAFRQILEAVGHMHTRGVVHCDLKPENILYEDDTDRQIKIADFGFAQFIPGGSDGGQTLTKQLGTLSYTAPEILMGIGYDTKADMWSLGVILYILLSGIPPFGKRRGETDHDVKRNICRGNWRFYDSHFRNVSEQAKDLVKCLIVLDPKKRLDYEQALSHSWFQGYAPERALGSEYIIELGNFNERRGMYKLASHALAGLVSRFAQPDAIAAISADSHSLSRVLQEGSIQPIISLAYSKLVEERKSACNAIANLALREQYQQMVIKEGGVRRLNQLALKEPPQPIDIRFFVALALARLAKNPECRQLLLSPNINADPNCSTHHALMRLSQSINPSRVSRQAVEALSLLALEEELHQQLVAGGILPALLRQCDPNQPSEFRRGALQALRCIFSCSSQQTSQNSVSVKELNLEINKIYTDCSTNMDSADLATAKDAKEKLRGMYGLMQMLHEETLINELKTAGGDQHWHHVLKDAAKLGIKVEDAAVPDLGMGDHPPDLHRSVSQMFNTMDTSQYKAHISSALTLLREVAARSTPKEPTQDDADVAMVDASALQEVQLSPEQKTKLEEIHAQLTKDRSHLMERIMAIGKGSRCNVPAKVQSVLTELTDVILQIVDIVHGNCMRTSS